MVFKIRLKIKGSRMEEKRKRGFQTSMYLTGTAMGDLSYLIEYYNASSVSKMIERLINSEYHEVMGHKVTKKLSEQNEGRN